MKRLISSSFFVLFFLTLYAQGDVYNSGVVGASNNITVKIDLDKNTSNTCIATSFATVDGRLFTTDELVEFQNNLQHFIIYPEDPGPVALKFTIDVLVSTSNPPLGHELWGRYDAETLNTTMTSTSVFVSGSYLHTYTGTVNLPVGNPNYDNVATKELTFYLLNAIDPSFTEVSLTTRVVEEATRWRTKPQWTVTSPEVPNLILRDPPGDRSYAFIENQKEICHGYGLSAVSDLSGEVYASVKLGKKGSAGIGVETEYEAYAEASASLEMGVRQTSAESYEMCFRTSEAFETDAGDTDDFPTGASADLYIGNSILYRYGFAERIYVQNCEPIYVKDFMFVPLETKSSFVHTDYFIRNQWIPTLEDSLAQAIQNGSTGVQQELEAQLEVWNNALNLNDEIKADANYNEFIEFSTGGITRTTEATIVETKSTEMNMYIEAEAALEISAEIDGSGGTGRVSVRMREERGQTTTSGSTQVNTTKWYYADDNAGDNFKVFLGTDPVFGLPVFELNASSQTSCPYEGGYQIDQPDLKFSNGSIIDSMVNIPVGGQGTFKIDVCNNSNFPRTYHLRIRQNSNASGARIFAFGPEISSTDNGVQLDTISSGQCITDAIVTVEQVNQSVLDYEDIELVLYPLCQPGTAPIESTVSLTARFSPVTSANDLEANGLSMGVVPNPNTGVFQLVLEDFNETGTLVMTDFTGRQVFTQSIPAHTPRIEINQSQLPRGLYFLVVENEKQRVGRKILLK